MSIYTIAMATRLKRKVFRSRNIPHDVIVLGQNAFAKEGAELKGYRFYDYGVVMCVECGSKEHALRIANSFRMATSGPVRKEYPELWRMPSLWNSRPLIEEGGMSTENIKRAEEYFESLKSR